MAETTVLRDADGTYVFATEALDAARTAEGTYDLSAEAVEAARLPDDRRDEIDTSLGLDEGSGFGIQPIPGIDIVIKKNPGGSAVMSNLGSFGSVMTPPFSAGGSAGASLPR